MNEGERDQLRAMVEEAAGDIASKARQEWRHTRYAHVIVVALPVSNLQFEMWAGDGNMPTVAMAVTNAAAKELASRIIYPLEGWDDGEIPTPEQIR